MCVCVGGTGVQGAGMAGPSEGVGMCSTGGYLGGGGQRGEGRGKEDRWVTCVR